MKKTILVLTLALAFITIIQAQDSLPLKRRIYKAKATTANSAVTGYLASVSDSSIFISPNAISLKFIETSNTNYKKIDYNNLTGVELKRKGSTERGLLIGGLIGIGIGAIGGLASGSDYKRFRPTDGLFGNSCIFCMTGGQKAVLYGATGAMAGTIIGMVAGALAHNTFVIGGRKEGFNLMKRNLRNRVTKKADNSPY